MIRFTDLEIESLLRKHREFEELLGRIIRDKRVEEYEELQMQPLQQKKKESELL